MLQKQLRRADFLKLSQNLIKGKGGGALCAGNAVALLVFGPVMP